MINTLCVGEFNRRALLTRLVLDYSNIGCGLLHPNPALSLRQLSFLLRYSVHKVFGTHRLTHSRMDRPECSMPPALFFNGGGSIEIAPSSKPYIRSSRNLRIKQRPKGKLRVWSTINL